MRPHFPSFVRLARVSAGLVRLFGIFVRCLGFYYDISAITMVRASERDTNRHIGREGRRGQDQDIDFLVDKSPESLAWIWGYWRQLRLPCPGMAQCYTGLQHYCYTDPSARVSLVSLFGLCFTFQPPLLKGDVTRHVWTRGMSSSWEYGTREERRD